MNLPSEIIEKILMNLSLEENLEFEELGYSNFIIKTKLKELSPERKKELWTKYVRTGNLKAIKVLHKHIPVIKEDIITLLITIAVHNGHLEVIKYIHSIIPLFPVNDEQIMIGRARDDRIDIVKYLHSIGYKYTNYTLDEAAKNGQLKVVKYLHSVRTKSTNWAIDLAASNGHLEVVKYLHSVGAKCTERAMEWAASNGHLEVVKYLHSVGTKCTEWTMAETTHNEKPHNEPCPQNQIKNPLTNRCITINGKLYNKLKKQNIL